MAVKETEVLLVTDTSNSMSDCMAAINEALRQIFSCVQKASILTYANRAKWQNPAGSAWKDLKAGGNTDFARACEELNKKMSPTGDIFAENPVIVLFSDGESSYGYKAALEKLTKNPAFKNAVKLVFAAGIRNTRAGFLPDFAGSSGKVHVFDPDAINDCVNIILKACGLPPVAVPKKPPPPTKQAKPVTPPPTEPEPEIVIIQPDEETEKEPDDFFVDDEW